MQAKYPEGQVHVMSADVVNYAALQAGLSRLQDSVGPIDIAVCSAGLAIPKELVDQQVSEAVTMMNVRPSSAVCMPQALPDPILDLDDTWQECKFAWRLWMPPEPLRAEVLESHKLPDKVTNFALILHPLLLTMLG
jgi:NAD(P)-dependent dehydrogenase (short-subunit alcohol dehydrogenase family)